MARPRQCSEYLDVPLTRRDMSGCLTRKFRECLSEVRRTSRNAPVREDRVISLQRRPPEGGEGRAVRAGHDVAGTS